MALITPAGLLPWVLIVRLRESLSRRKTLLLKSRVNPDHGLA